VKSDEGVRIPCRIRGKFRLEGWKLTNPVAVGDKVMVEKQEKDPIGQIVTIDTRENYVARQSPRQKHGLHLMAANIDQAVLVTTFVQPSLKPGFIDRFLLMTEGHEIPVLIFINKCDLLTEDEALQVRGLKSIYDSIGYQVIAGSAESNNGVSALKDYLEGKITLFAGQSGVGKSTLLNALEPGLGLRTADISDRSGKGLHTTTNAEMFPWGESGSVIDSPGIKNLSFNHFTAQDVAHNFREFFALSKDCKFGDCTHRNEPKCAVKDALEKGEVSALRYQHYLKILEEVEAQNAWDRPEL